MVSAIELGKSLSKLMIPITLFEKFSSETYLTTLPLFSIYNISIEIHRNILNPESE